MNDLYRNRDGVRAFELYIEDHSKPKLRCWIKGIPNDGRVIAKASFEQKGGSFFGYERL